MAGNNQYDLLFAIAKHTLLW